MSGEMAQYSGRNVVLMQGQLQIPGWTLVQLHQDRAEPWFRLAIIVCCILGCLLVQGYFYTLWQESERRRAIEISAARYRAMFENNLAPMLMVDTNSFDVMGCNAAACRFRCDG